MKKTPSEIYAEYTAARSYDASLDLSETIKMNQNFYVGKQWEGVVADDLEKPVFNITKLITNNKISQVISDDISVKASPIKEPVTAENSETLGAEIVTNMLNNIFDGIMERTRFKAKNREILKDAAVDGDCYLYSYFDTGINTGTPAKGDIQVEQAEMQNILFANTESRDIQSQPYIIVSSRRMLDSVRKEAKKNGIENWESIQADSDTDLYNSQYEQSNKVTVLIKIWKENGTVRMIKTTPSIMIREEWDTEYTLYPVSRMSWEPVKNSYRSQSLVTEIIPNQMFINKTYAMAMLSLKNNAFPKTVYNKNLLPGGWSNKVGAAIPVTGDPNAAIARAQGVGDMSGQVYQMIQSVMRDTKDAVGASDAVLGNINPDNTSAIIAVQKASTAPLVIQRMEFYQYIEDTVRIWLDIIATNYGTRLVKMELDGKPALVPFDFSQLRGDNMNLMVDVGESPYWSEIMQVQMLDNLFRNNIISDPVAYLEIIPDNYLQNKDTIIAKLKAAQAQQMQAALSMPQTPSGVQ